MVGKQAFKVHVVKQARKELRRYRIRRPERVLLAKNKTQAFLVAQHLLPQLFPRREIKVVGEERGALIPLSRDEFIAKFLNLFLSDEEHETIFSERFFLISLSQAELQRYADQHGLEKREPVLSRAELDALGLIARVQERQQQTEASILQSYYHLRKERGLLSEADKKHE